MKTKKLLFTLLLASLFTPYSWSMQPETNNNEAQAHLIKEYIQKDQVKELKKHLSNPRALHILTHHNNGNFFYEIMDIAQEKQKQKKYAKDSVVEAILEIILDAAKESKLTNFGPLIDFIVTPSVFVKLIDYENGLCIKSALDVALKEIPEKEDIDKEFKETAHMIKKAVEEENSELLIMFLGINRIREAIWMQPALIKTFKNIVYKTKKEISFLGLILTSRNPYRPEKMEYE